MSSKVWNELVTLLDVSATAAGSSWEFPKTATDVRVMFTQSGTASQVILQGSLDNSTWGNLFTTRSATFHAVTILPRYIRAITDGTVTVDSRVTIQMLYLKEAGDLP